MPRYEFSEGTSNKFWEIELNGSSFTTTYGRIGSTGQSTTKSFDTPVKARGEYDKLIAEKTKKGYQLVGGAPAAPTTAVGSAPVAAPAPVKAPPAPPPPKPVKPPPPVAAQVGPAPTAGEPTIVMSDNAKRAADRELAALRIEPRKADNPLGEWKVNVHDPFVRLAKTAVQNGAQSGDDDSKHLLASVLKIYGFEKMPATLDVDTSAAMLQVVHGFSFREDHVGPLVTFWVAHSGLPFALDAFTRSLWERTLARHQHGNSGVWLAHPQAGSPYGQRMLHDLFSARTDRLIHALYLGATDEQRAAARAHAEKLRAGASLLVRSAIASCLLETTWIDADLREHATTRARAMFSPDALARASAPADIAAYMAAQNVDDLQFYAGSARRWAPKYARHVEQQGFSYVQRHGLGGVDIILAQIAVVLEKFTPDNYGGAYFGSIIRELLEIARCAHDYPAAVATAIAIIDKTGDHKLGKEEDPRPAAYDCLRASPAIALPLVREAGKKGWAKNLLPQIERLAGGGSDDARPDAKPDDLPAAFRGAVKLKAPEFWQPAGFARIVLQEGTLYPLAHADALGSALKDSNRDAIAELRKIAEPETLASFAWDLFQAWLTSGSPAKDKWALSALGLLGSDETARRLTPLIRAWPGESQHQRAVAGLDVLGDIGSDVALMMLNGIAQKVKFKGLQERAREKMDQIAQKRGMTAEQLADRLVPDLDLEDDGSKTLDFGPRSFRVGFDETLSPFVIDATGTRLKDLPKPNSKDDATLAGGATEAWKAMKKDVRALASIQILRMELAMGNARRWTGEEFRYFFVEHPLLTHLVRRLVWGVYGHGKIERTFRVAEDRSCADQNDDAYDVPPTATIGIVHRLHLDDDAAAAWGKVFGDYELAQPFEQLARKVYRLDAHERAGVQLKRFEGRVIETKKLMSLLSRGWRKGQPQDAGNIFEFTKPISADLLAMLPFEMGINAGGFDYVDPTQKLGAIDFSPTDPSWGGARKDAVALTTVDDVILSEVIRDVESLGEAAS